MHETTIEVDSGQMY